MRGRLHVRLRYFLLQACARGAACGLEADVLCADRFASSSLLDTLTRRQGRVHFVSSERTHAVNYDQSRYAGFQGNDQGSNLHDYFFSYERIFSGLPRNLTMLNIGVLDGHSLRNYADFFGPRAQIVGLDISLALWSNISRRSWDWTLALLCGQTSRAQQEARDRTSVSTRATAQRTRAG
eukprot:2958863-Prymnesium_polylepis.2